MPVRNYIENFFSTQDEKIMIQLNQIAELISDDEVAVSLLNTLIDSSEKYFGAVVRMETRLKTARFRLEGEELRELTSELDRQRHYAHEALISNLHIFNRYLLKEFDDVPVGGIFTGNPEMIRDRIAVADWAGKLLCTIYNKRRK